MDAIRQDEVARARATAPEERARQALELMAVGIRLKRAALRDRHPGESEDQIEARLRSWLTRDE